jgi:Ion transport protein
MMLLIRTATGESWNYIMSDCYASQGIIAIIFWVVYIILTHFVFINIFVAVIYEAFNDIKSSEDANEVLSLKRKDIKAFISAWAFFNENGEHYMKTKLFPTFLMELPPPLGYEGIKIEPSKLNKIIFCLNIRDHEGKVYFPEVMWAIFHSIIGNNDEKVHKCE